MDKNIRTKCLIKKTNQLLKVLDYFYVRQYRGVAKQYKSNSCENNLKNKKRHIGNFKSVDIDCININALNAANLVLPRQYKVYFLKIKIYSELKLKSKLIKPGLLHSLFAITEGFSLY